MIYLDSSALLKLWRDEEESTALRQWWRSTTAPTVSSRLALIEVRRALARDGAPERTQHAATRLLESIATLPIDPQVESAACISPPPMRTLDAIHLATALALDRALTGVCTYDGRMASAASARHVPVISPGRE